MKVFITGGTTGIGFELARVYLEAGHDVGICGRDLSRIPESYTHPKLKAYTVDVTDLKTLKEVVMDFGAGELDLIVANAGRSVGKKTTTPNFEVAREIIDINVKGVLNTFEAALDIMIPLKKGHIAAVGSVAGMVGLPGAAPYSASKAAVLKLCESFAIDLKQFNIQTTAIAPGFIDTPLTQKNDHSMPFIMSARQGALRIKKALDRKEVLFVFPWQMKSVMYLLDRMPRFLYRFLMGNKLFNYSRKN